MTEATLAQRIGQFAGSTSFDTLPDDVVESVRKRVLDLMGLCIAAAPLATSRAARRFAVEQGGQGHAHAVGVPAGLPAPLAAFVNGVLAHSLDYDDTHLPSVLHPSAPVIPAALAAAEHARASGQATIAAIACGLETCVRIGMAGYDDGAGNSLFFEHGQHATSIAGTLGAAVAAAMLYGLGADGVTHALSVAASMASGIIEANRTGGTVKRMHCGWAAQSGVTAAQLVRLGFTGPPTVLEGRFGFFEAWLHGQYNPAAITEGLGEHWSVPGIFFKPYPANHFTHGGIDAALALRRRGVRADDVAWLRLGVAEPTVRTIGAPIETKRAPQTGYMAQFSGPYTVVAALLGGRGLGLGLDDFTDELARDPQRRALMARVEVHADERCTKTFPYQFPAVLRAGLHDGQELVEEVLVNRGGPQRPLSAAELGIKFADNAGRLLPPEVVARVRDTALQLADIDNTSSLIKPLSIVDRPGIEESATAPDEEE